jgi:chloramphenicol 3-O-phosphotransferase
LQDDVEASAAARTSRRDRAFNDATARIARETAVHPDLRITSDVRLVLVTGNPGGWKSTVTKIVYSAQTEEWRMLSLDDYFYLAQSGPQYSDNWDRFEASAPIRAAILKYIGDRRGKVLAEGIIQTDREVTAYCAAMGLTPKSPQVRFFDLRCPREEAARRMQQRPLQEEGMAQQEIETFAQHFDYITPKLKATGATPISTAKKTPVDVAVELVRALNAP